MYSLKQNQALYNMIFEEFYRKHRIGHNRKGERIMKRYSVALAITVSAVFICSGVVSAKDQPDGEPFNAIWKAITYIQSQIDHIKVIPGPQGSVGPIGPQGPKGDRGQDAQVGAGNISFMFNDTKGVKVLLKDGQVWSSPRMVNDDRWSGWTRIKDFNPPIPALEIIEWKFDNFLDKYGNIWIKPSHEPLPDYCNSNDDSQSVPQATNYCCQTFTASSSYTILKIRIKAYKHCGVPGIWNIGVYETDFSKPIGLQTPLCEGTIDANIFTPSPGAWHDVQMGTGGSLLSGGVYSIVIMSTTSDINNYSAWRMDDSTPSYSGGEAYYSLNNGVDWRRDGSSEFGSHADFMFEVYSTDQNQEFINLGSPPM